jgi:hypothetical protein
MGTVQQVIDKVNDTREAIKATFPKVEPRLVLALILDHDAKEKQVYTLEIILKPHQDTDRIRQQVLDMTGFTPGFYLGGTKMIVSHPLDLDFLKWINDQEGIEKIKGSAYSAGGSTDF